MRAPVKGQRMTTDSQFGKLLDLARERDSDRRRELLRQVTDLFFETRGARSQSANSMFGDILQTVAADMQDSVLVELSERFADAPDAPIGLMKDLANHSFEVAAPVLRHSTVLSDADLLEVVRHQSQMHIGAIAQRPTVSEALSAEIVRVGDDNAVDALIRNDGAALSRGSMEPAVERARRNAMLHEGVVRRRDMPLDLLNEMYFVVEQRLRAQILDRNASVDPAELDAALARARNRMQRAVTHSNEDMRKAHAFILVRKGAGELNGRLLVALLREHETAKFLHGLAELTNVDVETAAQIVERKDMDALAMICRAADIERMLFVTLCVLLADDDAGVMRGEQFGELYEAVPLEAAQRAMRFFKLRKAAEGRAAA